MRVQNLLGTSESCDSSAEGVAGKSHAVGWVRRDQSLECVHHVVCHGIPGPVESAVHFAPVTHPDRFKTDVEAMEKYLVRNSSGSCAHRPPRRFPRERGELEE